jgi:hypothetical protein
LTIQTTCKVLNTHPVMDLPVVPSLGLYVGIPMSLNERGGGGDCSGVMAVGGTLHVLVEHARGGGGGS